MVHLHFPISTGGNQNIFQTVDADTGTTTANPTDTLTVAGGANISTSIVGDTLSIAYTGSSISGEENPKCVSQCAGRSCD